MHQWGRWLLCVSSMEELAHISSLKDFFSADLWYANIICLSGWGWRSYIEGATNQGTEMFENLNNCLKIMLLLKIIILCIWKNVLTCFSVKKKHYFSYAVHYFSSSMPSLSQMWRFLQSPSLHLLWLVSWPSALWLTKNPQVCVKCNELSAFKVHIKTVNGYMLLSSAWAGISVIQNTGHLELLFHHQVERFSLLNSFILFSQLF